jgi:RNA recognition motif-containing protein
VSRLFVGNLPYSITDEELKAHVIAAGVQVDDLVIIKDRESGQSRGFGFVTTAMDVQEAVQALDGHEVQGRSLRVNEAHERTPRGGGGGFRGGPPPETDRRRGGKKKKRRRRNDDYGGHDNW